MTDLPTADAILGGLRFRSFCRKCAVSSGSDRAVLHALDAVVRARRLTDLAANAGLDRGVLTESFDRAASPGMSGIKCVIASLVKRWEAAWHDVSPKLSGRDSPESDEI